MELSPLYFPHLSSTVQTLGSPRDPLEEKGGWVCQVSNTYRLARALVSDLNT